MIPAGWMPAAKMQRIIIHWTAGGHKASAVDKGHYHILIEADGKLVKGVPSIKANEAPAKKGYAAHTLNCNSGSIGVSLCCMAGAIENPFKAGKAPMTEEQWAAMIDVVAELCERYGVAVTPKTVLTHAEVQGNLGIKQRGKWDITRLAFEPQVKGAKAVGDMLRAEVREVLRRPADDPPPENEDHRKSAGPAAALGPPSALDPAPSLIVSEAEAAEVQALLRAKGYYSVLTVDGDAAGRTQEAILAFRNENGLPLSNRIDAELLEALRSAPRRYVPPEREYATKRDIIKSDSSVADPLNKTWWQKLWAVIVGVPAGAATLVSGAADNVEAVKEKVEPVQSFFADVPGWSWGLIILAAAIVIYLSSQGIDRKLIDMSRRGEVG